MVRWRLECFCWTFPHDSSLVSFVNNEGKWHHPSLCMPKGSDSQKQMKAKTIKQNFSEKSWSSLQRCDTTCLWRLHVFISQACNAQGTAILPPATLRRPWDAFLLTPCWNARTSGKENRSIKHRIWWEMERWVFMGGGDRNHHFNSCWSRSHFKLKQDLCDWLLNFEFYLALSSGLTRQRLKHMTRHAQVQESQSLCRTGSCGCRQQWGVSGS